MSAAAEVEPFRAGEPSAWRIAAFTALTYALLGGLALMLAGSPGYASPLYPAAGVALAAALVHGRPAAAGAGLGAFVVNVGLAWHHGRGGPVLLLTPLLIALGAALQAGAGAALVRRFVTQPLVLDAPRDIFRFSLLGAVLACAVSPSVATVALLATGAIAAEDWAGNWLTWWTGDTLGVLIAAPLALIFIGRPRADWQPRLRMLGLPLLIALALLAVGTIAFARLDAQRVMATFQRDADALTGEALARLDAPLHALQALHGSVRGRANVDRETLRQATRWWLTQPIPMQATGYSARVTLDGLAAFEAEVRAQGEPGYRVFDRDGGKARAADGEVVAMRFVEPAQANSGAMGINALSVPAARAAIIASRDSGQPAASAGFALTQSKADETGVVIYQALYRGEPTNTAERQALFRGVIFVTVRTDRAWAGLAGPGQDYLRWCLVDIDPAAVRRRLAGPAGCENLAPLAADFQARRQLDFGGRSTELRISAPATAVPGHQLEAGGSLALAGLLGSALLGALLLTVTGHSRRTRQAVQDATAELRREMAERSQTENALRESQARLRSILDHVPLGVMFIDPQGCIIESNPRSREMLGCSEEQLGGLSVLELVQPDEATRLIALRRTLLTGTGTVVERLRLADAHGHGKTVRASASSLRDGQGMVLRVVCVLEDITESLRLEDSQQALQRAEAANLAKSEFVSRMSHELRTPLNAMIGFAQLLGLDREPRLVDHHREWVQQIQRAGWHLLEMINETLDLARIESGNVQLNLAPVALQPLVASCLALVASDAAKRGIVIAQSIEHDAGAVVADATRLTQVLTNLLSNGVKYNRNGGALTLTTRRLPATQPASSDQIEIAISDTGMGMSTEQLQALFQPYNRLGREGSGIEGTGIGLVISRRLAELMGGTLEPSSEAGVGSIFTLRLPAADSAQAPELRASDTLPAPYRERRVHYVEDNETNIEVMRGVFAQRPQIVLETSMLGLDGLAAIRVRKPDLVLLDMQLPDIPGIELLRHLKRDEELARIPVVVVSADATTDHVQQALQAGALHYVTKPLDLVEFLELVDVILDDLDSRWG